MFGLFSCKLNLALPNCITGIPIFTVKHAGIKVYLILISLSPQVKIRQLVSIHLSVLPTCSPAYQPTFVFVLLRQVFVSCNFCGKSISYSCSAMPHQGRGFSQYGVSGSPTKSKVTSCPGCRKPLPRCALCLMNMGTPVSNCPGKPACVEYVDRCSCRHLGAARVHIILIWGFSGDDIWTLINIWLQLHLAVIWPIQFPYCLVVTHTNVDT